MAPIPMAITRDRRTPTAVPVTPTANPIAATETGGNPNHAAAAPTVAPMARNAALGAAALVRLNRSP